MKFKKMKRTLLVLCLLLALVQLKSQTQAGTNNILVGPFSGYVQLPIPSAAFANNNFYLDKTKNPYINLTLNSQQEAVYCIESEYFELATPACNEDNNLDFSVGSDEYKGAMAIWYLTHAKKYLDEKTGFLGVSDLNIINKISVNPNDETNLLYTKASSSDNLIAFGKAVGTATDGHWIACALMDYYMDQLMVASVDNGGVSESFQEYFAQSFMTEYDGFGPIPQVSGPDKYATYSDTKLFTKIKTNDDKEVNTMSDLAYGPQDRDGFSWGTIMLSALFKIKSFIGADKTDKLVYKGMLTLTSEDNLQHEAAVKLYNYAVDNNYIEVELIRIAGIFDQKFNLNLSANHTSDFSDITIHCFYDTNGNGRKDSGEFAMNNINFLLNGKNYYTGNSGNINTTFQDTSLTIDIIKDSDLILTKGTSQTTIHRSQNRYSSEDLTFGLQYNVEKLSAIGQIEMADAVCNEITKANCTIRNTGSDTIVGKITFQFSNNITPSANTLMQYQMNQNEISKYLEILPSQELSLFPEFIVDGPESIGEQIKLNANLIVNRNNLEVPVFEASYENQLLCSFDPNDKLSNINRGSNNYIDTNETIVYTIRFQNTGNYPAENIVIVDQLSDQLDLETFKPLDASHSYHVAINGREIRFVFPQIFLPDSTTNESQSHGYIRYRIKPVSELNPGDKIENTAAIYFDQNPAILTNTTLHTILEADAVKDIYSSQFTILPNPIRKGDLINIEFGDDLAKDKLNIILLNALGQEISSSIKDANSRFVSIPTSNLDKTGLHIVMIRTNTINIVKKILIIN